ncbi:MAG: endonuclease III [Burkholderiales bacterium]|nr:endonuclease III [Burkholderiales bacterium]OUT78719.1 MAG: endonuclease III [Betaproteobacteria bacterium TMED22]|tara:strand:+ start:15053 stop:15685 length:633 start_codon:yes stop_codon:yes gene_type:complete
MNRNNRTLIFKRLAEQNPNPTTELIYESTFELLIAVILSAQATDTSVNKVTRRLFKIANTPDSILKLGLNSLTEKIKSIGLYRNKAKNVISTCHLLIAEYHGEVPRDRLALQSLPGVGRKTANVVLNTAFGDPTIAVDTHIFRVSNRTKLARGKNVDEVEQRLLKNTPKQFLRNAHHWILLHGRYVCKARKPDCESCIILDLCEYKGKLI